MRIKSGSPEPQHLGEEPTKASKEAVPAETNLDALPSSLTEEIRNKNSELTKEMELPEPTNAAQTGLQKPTDILRRGWETRLLKSWSAIVEEGLNETPDATHLAKQNPQINLSFLPPMGTARLDYMAAQRRLGQETVWA